MSELIDISNFYKDRAEWYGERMVKYLKQYASTTFLPEYLTGGQTIDSLVPTNSAFTMPIFLDDFEYPINLDKNNCNNCG